MNPIPETKETIIAKAQSNFDDGYNCSQSVLLAFKDQFNLDERTAKLISSAFGGGMGRLRKTCGAITGGFMVLGLAYGNEKPNDMQTKLYAYKKVRDLYHQVKEIHGTSTCKVLLEKHITHIEVEERKHHKTICRQLIADVAGLVYEQLKQDREP